MAPRTGKVIDVHNTGPSEDAFRNPVQLYERISWMIGPTVGTPGSGSSGADLAPTAQQIAVNDEFKQQLAQIQVEVKPPGGRRHARVQRGAQAEWRDDRDPAMRSLTRLRGRAVVHNVVSWY